MIKKIWANNPQFIEISNEISKLLKSHAEIKISGLTDTAFSSFIASLSETAKINFLIVIEKERDIIFWAEKIESFTNKKPLSYISDYPLRQIEVLKKITSFQSNIIITTPKAVSEKVIPPKILNKMILNIRKGTSYDSVHKAIIDGGYVRVNIVGEEGEYARRGEIIDLWSPSSNNPIRILFELDNVKNIKSFATGNQLTKELINETNILPVSFGGTAKSTISEYLGNNFIVVLTEEKYENCAHPENLFSKGVCPLYIRRVHFHRDNYEFKSREFLHAGDVSSIKSELDFMKEYSYRVILSAPGKSEINKLSELVFDEYSIIGETFISPLNNGFICEDIKTAVLTISDILGYHRRYAASQPVKVYPMEEFADLKLGDYITHKKFGLGLFEGLTKIKHNNTESDFLKIKYSGGGRLYVAVENTDMVQKYAGAEAIVTLDSLSGKSWKKKIFAVRKSIREFSEKLVKLYDKQIQKGISFFPDIEMEKEFNSYFPYNLTRHQKESIDNVLRDMESENAMDRLVLGDVGYGKTEVAMRAAFRAVLNGKQVVLITPTVILARQHFQRFTERFRGFPVMIEMFSRFVNLSQQKKIVEKINTGRVDIIIGTHRLFSESLKFPALGLFIIDEEQRFGVEQKEKLRFKYKNMDVLTLTATPIPRTLSMALGKVKGLSLINTPPPGRFGIKTQTLPYNIDTIVEAIRQEVSRGGQCYYIHPRIKTIGHITELLKQRMKNIKIRYIHGRLKPHQIDDIMISFINREFDCLVSTTIVENGLDIPNVNTMIIDDVRMMGIADIYQLRGRIGRTNIRAYCYLMYPPNIDLTDKLKKKLSALTSFSAIGGGFQLALRDLQLRGAGELLGSRQHGNIMKIGFDRYSSILRQELAKARGEEYISPPDVEITLPVSAFIPAYYIDSSELRLSFYRKLSSIADEKELSKLKDELKDRFGKIPAELICLIDIIYIKIEASRAKINSISFSDSKVLFRSINGATREVEMANAAEGKNILKKIKKAIKNKITNQNFTSL